MINSYVGGAGYLIMAQHGQLDETVRAMPLLDVFAPRWAAGGLRAAVVQSAAWSQWGNYFTEVARSEGKLKFLRNKEDYDTMSDDQFGIFVSVEGHGGYAGDFEALFTLDAMGATCFTFSHNRQNLLCTGSNEPFGGGFTYLGKQTLRIIKETKLMVDLVHMSRDSFWDAARYYDGPLFVSHSNCAALLDHPRNITDDQLKLVAERGGVVGLNTFRGYVTAEPMKATISDLVDHAMHMYDLIGPDHMALGADMCESPVEMLVPVLDWVDPEGAHGIKGRGKELYETALADLPDASTMSKIAVEVAARGVPQEDVDKIFGGSYLAMLERAKGK